MEVSAEGVSPLISGLPVSITNLRRCSLACEFISLMDLRIDFSVCSAFHLLGQSIDF